jgi:hypothetical protein
MFTSPFVAEKCRFQASKYIIQGWSALVSDGIPVTFSGHKGVSENGQYIQHSILRHWDVGALRLGCSVYKHLLPVPSGHQTSDGEISDGTGDVVLQLRTIFRLRMTGSHWVTAYQNDLSPCLETKKTFGGWIPLQTPLQNTLQQSPLWLYINLHPFTHVGSYW